MEFRSRTARFESDYGLHFIPVPSRVNPDYGDISRWRWQVSSVFGEYVFRPWGQAPGSGVVRSTIIWAGVDSDWIASYFRPMEPSEASPGGTYRSIRGGWPSKPAGWLWIRPGRSVRLDSRLDVVNFRMRRGQEDRGLRVRATPVPLPSVRRSEDRQRPTAQWATDRSGDQLAPVTSRRLVEHD